MSFILFNKVIGEMRITVEPAIWRDEQCYLVHANSDGVIDKVPIGTSVTAYVDSSMRTLEQTHYEYVKIPDNPLDRRTFLSLDDGVYTVKKTMSQGVEIKKSEFQFTSEEFKGFISEGSNILLQRVMVKKGVPDQMVFLTFDSDTNLRTSSYRLLGEKSELISDDEKVLLGLERTIHISDDTPHTWHAYFLDSGHLASRTQLGSRVIMTLVSLPKQQVQDATKSTTDEKKTKPLKWDEDMQLYSRFLDRKAELSDDHATYMRRHPELRALLADFLQFLLLRKPDDVCEFASDFFAAFSSGSPSGPSFARSETSNVP
ncbi:hypothetical protein QZH41_019455 [Actinostola sp. cb2023]|nr:hypothetical protein QZH41_019455 [Actinostola sp. cb2023]